MSSNLAHLNNKVKSFTKSKQRRLFANSEHHLLESVYITMPATCTGTSSRVAGDERPVLEKLFLPSLRRTRHFREHRKINQIQKTTYSADRN